MKRSACIELLETHNRVTIYTFRFDGSDENEFDKFYNRFDSDAQLSKDLDKIAYWMARIGSDGMINDYLRPEGAIYVKALPIVTSELRLYCYKVTDRFLLVGGGGKKTTRTFQEDPILESHVKNVKKVGNKILRYIGSGKIVVVDNELTGKLCFEVEL